MLDLSFKAEHFGRNKHDCRKELWKRRSKHGYSSAALKAYLYLPEARRAALAEPPFKVKYFKNTFSENLPNTSATSNHFVHPLKLLILTELRAPFSVLYLNFFL